jgi:hypothetical protein
VRRAFYSRRPRLTRRSTFAPFEQSGTLADTKMMTPTPAVEQHFTLNGFAIDRVVVTPASPADETRVIELCH